VVDRDHLCEVLSAEGEAGVLTFPSLTRHITQVGWRDITLEERHVATVQLMEGSYGGSLNLLKCMPTG